MSEAGHNSSRRMWLDQSPQRSGPMNFADSVNSAARQTSVNVTTGYRYNVRSASPIMSADVHTLKRSRSPTMAPPGVSTTRSHVLEFDSEREIQAKAKRLARFSAELNKPVSDLLDQNRNIFSEAKASSTVDKKFAIGYSGKETAVLQGTKHDQEERGPSAPIVGFCQDMCPELERDERERKGDLDQYERLDGDRNQTHISLAVKKYNRTAEREAALIRPMPVLRKTMDYLLHLLDQPYDDKFLGMYNFLWDRMRAVRMDLRMQHIFNQDAIIMLEQMIRLHIVAMHELCEYQKGEGFSEGFDAHLNIEQMNKASVELFQMYDDHRKKGLVVMTENEFRGYYALLKLDRHPGYKVEPAELSLDLAKMTPSLRCSKEISFARDVARACRIGNFIAFFRLARKATYLQACLMHAHFSKVRTNALASLHSGLQNSQGIPIAQVVQWLGMEAEDIESLLEYHGFVIKSFEEAYMVKEGPFLNRDTDYTTKRSELVHCNKSRKIIDDVSSNLTVSVTRSSALSDEKNNFGNPLKRNRPSHRTTKFPLVSDTKNTFGYNQLVFATPLPAQRKIAHEEIAFPSVKTQLATPDVEMPDFVDVSIQKNDKGFQPSLPEIPSSLFLSYDENIQEKSHQNGILPISSYESQINYPLFTGDELTEPAKQAHASLEPVDRAEERVTQIQMETTPKLDMILVGPYQKEIHENKQKEEEALSSVAHEKSEAAKQRFRMILRTWKRRASRKREIREQRQKLASIALNSLPLGPPVCQNEAQSRDGGKFNLDFVLEERNERHWSSWSRLNVANTVASTLKKKNAKAKCLCWKLAVCIHKGDQEKRLNNLMHTWLLSKLIGRKGENDNELVAVSSGLSIWKNVVDGQGNFGPSICFSIVREVSVEDCSRGASYDAMVGSSAAIYVVAESVPLEIQKVQIDMLLTSIQSKSSIPLLILCSGGSFSKYGHLVINRLGLQDVDKSRVSDISVISLDDVVPEEHLIGYFSDRNLQLGLKWLAEKTPPQPSLHLVKTRELVLRYLNPSIEALNDLEPSEIDPNRCIALFNEALDQSAKQIQDAAEMNANFWPCPEIDLLGQIELPSTDWSSAVKIKPILDAIKGCKLPYLSHDLSFLSHGSHLGKVIPLHKAKLEECLVNYLTQSSKIMSGDLAMKEAHLMLQNGASLELHGLQYYLIPRWVDIFQRIYNWRLIKMKSREFASAYVLDTVASIKSEPLKLDLDSPLVPKSKACAVDGFLLKDSRQVLPIHSRPLLDEMVGVSCRFLPEEDDVPVRSLETRSDVLVAPPHPAAGIGISEGEDLRFGRLSEAEGAIVSAPISQGTLINPIAAAAVGFGKLRTLFEKCKIIQDRIDQKLSLYF